MTAVGTTVSTEKTYCPEVECIDNKNGYCTFKGTCARKSFSAVE